MMAKMMGPKILITQYHDEIDESEEIITYANGTVITLRNVTQIDDVIQEEQDYDYYAYDDAYSTELQSLVITTTTSKPFFWKMLFPFPTPSTVSPSSSTISSSSTSISNTTTMRWSNITSSTIKNNTTIPSQFLTTGLASNNSVPANNTVVTTTTNPFNNTTMANTTYSITSAPSMSITLIRFAIYLIISIIMTS